MNTSPTTESDMHALLVQAGKRIEQLQSNHAEKIAVIGMAARLPGAEDLDAFWALLEAGRSGLQAVEASDLTAAAVSPEVSSDPSYVPVWGGPAQADGFDAGFFGYAPREAEFLDPQQRLFLECAWHAMEDAGQGAPTTPARVGVFAGASLSSYLLRAVGRADPFDAGLANIGGMVAARTSFHLDLKGPSIGVQTTCSSALVALEQAMRGLQHGSCDIALAGAVAINQARPEGYSYQEDGIVSPDGICRPFDAQAKGTVFTNGVGVVVLKRLSDAQRDGDTIHGVLVAAAVNNDGADKVGLTAPSVSGQAAVLTDALRQAGLHAQDIDYVEAHGTGTAIGDPIELSALNRAYGPGLTRAGRRCALGAVKGNTGHLDAAAGMAGVFKILLALRNDHLPATAHFTAPNPACHFGAFDMLAKGRAWPRDPMRPRRAGLSSFGIGGTNAHLIIEEPPAVAVRPETTAPQILPISAKTPEALAALRAGLADAIETGAEPLADVAFTLQCGRKSLPHRQAIVARDKADAVTQLRAEPATAPAQTRTTPEPVFVFSGQGTQRAGMARDLYAELPLFRAAMEACLSHMADADALRVMLLDPAAPEAAQINETRFTQPALFIVEYALARHWLGLGVVPVAMLGHSIGELTAATLAGVFDLPDACRLVQTRGQAMQACAPGAMLAVMMSEGEAQGSLPEGVEIAAVNGPRSVVLAGPEAAIADLATWFDRSGLGCKRLVTSHGFHSAAMDPALDPFRAALDGVTLSPPTIPMLSNITGGWLSEVEATDPAYWVRHLRETVRYGDCVAQLAELDAPLLLEIGPGGGLVRMARQTLRGKGRGVASLPEAGTEDGLREVLSATGALWVAGLCPDWAALHDGGARRVSLPGYPFERQSYWLPPVSPGDATTVPRDDPAEWVYQPVWSRLPVSVHAGAGPQLILGACALSQVLPDWPKGAIGVVASPEGAFRATSQGYAMDPNDPVQYRQLFAALAELGLEPTDITVAWALGAGAGLFQGAIAFARALADTALRPRVTLLGAGMEDATGGENLSPETAMVHGLLPVLRQELPGVLARTLDLDAADLGRPVAGLRNALYCPWDDTRRLSLRKGRLWGLAHQRTSAPTPAPSSKTGAVLLTGDLTEGLALAYARGVRGTWQAPLILAGHGLPDPAEWDQWLGPNRADTPEGQMITALRAMGQIGTDILVYCGDDGDADWLESAVTDAEARVGGITHVIHTSAMGDSFHLPLIEADGPGITAMMDRKRRGVMALRRALASRQAEVCLVQSSLSVLAGGHGFAGYAAANAWLDGECARANRDGETRWCSVNWDVAETGSIGQSVHGMSKLRVLTGAEVWDISRAILDVPGLTQAVVCPIDLDARLRAAMEPVRAEPSHSVTRTTAYIAPRDAYETAVAEIMADMLGVADIGAEDNFFELGGHSLLAIQIINKLRRRYQVDLPVRALLYEAPTVAGIAGAIRIAVEAAETEAKTLETLLDSFDAPTATTQETVG